MVTAFLRHLGRTSVSSASAFLAFGLITFATVVPAKGEEKQLPLSSLSSRLPATAEEGRKAVDQRDYGVVTINERVLALPIDLTEAQPANLAVHSDVFDYYMLPITVGVAGLDGSQVKSFQFEFSLPDRRVADSDVWIVDVFPRLETAKGRLTADAEVLVSGQLEMSAITPASPMTGGAKVDGKTSIAWKYNPVFQSFAAVFSEATAIWSFDRVGDTLKAGPIDARLLIAVNKDGRIAERKGVNLLARIRAEFSGGLFFGRYAGTEATIRVKL